MIDLLTLRPGVIEDRAFILATWLKGLRFGNLWYRLIEDKIYFRMYHRVIESILAKPGVSITVACLKEDPMVIVGYSISEGDKLHWVHVKKAWRKIKTATALVSPNTQTVTHLTDTGKTIFLRKNWTFNPFTLY